MALKIDYDELQIAMSFPMGGGRHYLDTGTGEVLPVSDWVEDQARHHDDPAGIAEESIRLAWHLLWYEGDVGAELPEAEERTMAQQADFCQELAAAYPEAVKISLILDNLNTHDKSAFYENLSADEAFALAERCA